MNKKKLAIGILLVVIAPIILFRFMSCVERYLPRTKSYEKYPYEFEEAFNEQMAEYGMSIDIDSVPFNDEGNYAYKAIPIQCEDQSKIYCTYYPVSGNDESLIMWIEFKQQTTGVAGEAIYIEPLLAFLLQEFETPVTEDRDNTRDPYSAVTYNEAVRYCRDFLVSSEEKTHFDVSAYKGDYARFIMKHTTGDQTSYILQLAVLPGFSAS